MLDTVYADTQKNTEVVRSPSLTILGEGTPETFFDNIRQEHISEGLIPRFLVMQYAGERPRRNRSAFFDPPEVMVGSFVAAAEQAMRCEQSDIAIHVSMTRSAEDILDGLDVIADDRINSATADADAQVWNRAHLKALKLAALAAVGCNHMAPVIDDQIANWAVEFVLHSSQTLLDSIDTREQLAARETAVRECVLEYQHMSPEQRRTYQVPKKLLGRNKLYPYSYLRRRLMRVKAFEDRRGKLHAIDETLQMMCSVDKLIKNPATISSQAFATKTTLYTLGTCF